MAGDVTATVDSPDGVVSGFTIDLYEADRTLFASRATDALGRATFDLSAEPVRDMILRMEDQGGYVVLLPAGNETLVALDPVLPINVVFQLAPPGECFRPFSSWVHKV